MTDPDIAYPEQHVQELVKTINTLRAERDEARRELDRLGPLLLHAASALNKVCAERDEARREVCDLKCWNFDRAIKPEDYALLRKWGCFPPAT